jgi:hypothetical protein
VNSPGSDDFLVPQMCNKKMWQIILNDTSLLSELLRQKIVCRGAAPLPSLYCCSL